MTSSRNLSGVFSSKDFIGGKSLEFTKNVHYGKYLTQHFSPKFSARVRLKMSADVRTARSALPLPLGLYLIALCWKSPRLEQSFENFTGDQVVIV